jgi:ABC-type transporter Mla subunit MlaD
MRKILFLSVAGVVALFLLNVFATPPAALTWTVRLHAPHGLQTGDAVQEGERRIGRVVAVESRTEGDRNPVTDVLITIDPSFRGRLHERSMMLVTTPAGAKRPVLRLIVFDDKSPLLPPGHIIAGADSEMEVELKRQLMAAEGVIRGLSRQLDDWRQTLDSASRSDELKKLEDGVGGLLDTFRKTQEEVARTVTREIDRLRKLYEKLFPPKHEETALLFPSPFKGES